MRVRLGLALGLACAFCMVGATPVLADYYDDFSDGSYLRVPPGPWDPCDPNWSIQVVAGLATADANDGALRLYVQTSGLFDYGLFMAYVDEGDHDPNTSPYWFDDSAPHWVLSRVQWRDPNFGGAALILHGNCTNWYFYNLQFEWPEGQPSQKLILGHGDGPTWREASATGGSSSEEPNMDRYNGFWMLMQFEGDGDPNNSYLRAACWNGDKFDWDGFWKIEEHILTGWADANVTPYVPSGICGVASYFYQTSTGPNTPPIPQADNKFDNIEARWGYFGDQFPPATLTLALKDANAINVEPNLPQYPKGMVVVCDAVCNGTKAFKKWTIKGPNDETDPLYQVIVDTNEILYLTMAGDYVVKATCKCGGGAVEPFAGMVLLVLGLTVVIRRLT